MGRIQSRRALECWAQFSFEHVDHRISASFLVSTGPCIWGRYWVQMKQGEGLWQRRHHFGGLRKGSGADESKVATVGWQEVGGNQWPQGSREDLGPMKGMALITVRGLRSCRKSGNAG